MIGFIPSHLRKVLNLNNIDLESLDWPCENTKPQGKICDLTQNDHILIFPSSKMFFRRYKKIPCQISLIMVEPYPVHGRFYLALRLFFWRKFKYVFARYSFLKGVIPNIRIIPTVRSWVDYRSLKLPEKYLATSLISSEKRHLKGHKLRHKVIETILAHGYDIDVVGRGYKPFKDKQEGLAPYKFSIIIENCREPDYFSEKLLDCLICETIPIYWGASNISEYFNMEGIIECSSFEDIMAAIKSIPNLEYSSFSEAIEENKTKAIHYSSVLANIAKMLDKNCKT